MAKLIINGQRPISGTLSPMGAKNAILPLLAATLLCDDVCSLTGVPAISDVRIMLRLMGGLGADYQISHFGEDVKVTASGLSGATIHDEAAAHIRGSNLMLGPLLARFGEVQAYYPGGDKIGERSMAAHFNAFAQCGYAVHEYPENGYFIIKKETEIQDDIHVFLYEPSVTATENILLLNVLRTGQTFVENAACEPHVRDLCTFLKAMGADITGEGSNRITIKGVKKLHAAQHHVLKDPIYIGSFIIFALVTGGDLYIDEVNSEDMLPILTALRYFNVRWEFVEKSVLHIPGAQDLRFNEACNIYSNVGIYSQPWPSFPSDLLPVLAALATQSTGKFLFFEKMYADRIKYISEINKLGANACILDPHRALVTGKTRLIGASLTCPDIRSGILYVASMLSAEGKSELDNIAHLERAYPKIDSILLSLGADVTKYEETTQEIA